MSLPAVQRLGRRVWHLFFRLRTVSGRATIASGAIVPLGRITDP